MSNPLLAIETARDQVRNVLNRKDLASMARERLQSAVYSIESAVVFQSLNEMRSADRSGS